MEAIEITFSKIKIDPGKHPKTFEFGNIPVCSKCGCSLLQVTSKDRKCCGEIISLKDYVELIKREPFNEKDWSLDYSLISRRSYSMKILPEKTDHKFYCLGFRKERKNMFLNAYGEKPLARMEFLFRTLNILFENDVVSKATYGKRMDRLCGYELKRIKEKLNTELTMKNNKFYKNVKPIIFEVIKEFRRQNYMSLEYFEKFLKENPEYLEFV